jgi:hypothetical protein
MRVPAPAHYPPIAIDTWYGAALGLFPVNILHDSVHLLFGLWGVLAYRSFGAARFYARAVAIIYVLFAVMGLIPTLDTALGFVPLFGNDVWLHLLLAAPAAYFGFIYREVDRGRM